MPFKRVFILHHHHAKHRYNPHRCEKKKFKNTASYLSVALLSQAMFVTYLFVESKQNNGTTKSLNAIRIAFLTPTNLSA